MNKSAHFFICALRPGYNLTLVFFCSEVARVGGGRYSCWACCPVSFCRDLLWLNGMRNIKENILDAGNCPLKMWSTSLQAIEITSWRVVGMAGKVTWISLYKKDCFLIRAMRWNGSHLLFNFQISDFHTKLMWMGFIAKMKSEMFLLDLALSCCVKDH